MVSQNNSETETWLAPLRRAFQLCACATLLIMGCAKASALSLPVITPPGGVFTTNVIVIVNLAGSTNSIRYTPDGTEPGLTAPLYQAPLQITNSVMLKARVFEGGTNAGPMAAEGFTLLDTNVTGFSSTLPVVVISTFGHVLPPASNAPLRMQVFNLASNQHAALTGTAEFSGPVKLKPRGFTSQRNPKKSYSVETLDAEGESAAVSLLGMPADHDWVLYAPYADKTMLRDVLAYELSNKLGHYASRTRFVEVFINDTTNRLSRAHYAGVYVLEEKVKIATQRVALHKLSPHDEAEPDITGGYLFKKDHLEKAPVVPVTNGPVRGFLPHWQGLFPSGPGGFPAAAAGFTPVVEDFGLLGVQSIVTNSILETNLVAGTNLTLPTLAVTVVRTNPVVITNLVAVTNSIVVTNLVAATNSVIATNMIAGTKPVIATNAIVAAQSVSGTNVVATASQVDAATAVITTTMAITTATTYRTNFVVVTNIVAITNAMVVTNLVAVTNAVVATNALVSSVPWLLTNRVLVTNVFSLGLPEPLPSARRLAASGEGFYTLQANAFFYVEPKPAKITEAQRTWLTGYLNRFEQALYGPDFRNPTNGYAAFIDVDSFIDHHLFVEATKNVDGFRFSSYFTKDRGGKLKMEPVWDWNLSFGNSRGKQGYMAERWLWPQLNDQEYSWFRRLFEDPEFGQRYVDRWAAWRTNVFQTSNLLARVDEIAASLQEPAARNFERWPIMGVLVAPQYVVGKTYAEEVQNLKTWMTNRFAWMDAQFVPPPVVTRAAATTNTADAVSFTVLAGQVYFTTDGTDPRRTNGAVSSAAHVYQTPVALTNAVTIVARARHTNGWSSPVSVKVFAKQVR